MIGNKAVYVSRADELDNILHCVTDAECCAIVGLSNMGKSVLLRSVGPSASARLGQVQAADYAFVYIDFNLMVGTSEQAFYELVLRSAMAMLSGLDIPSPVRERLQNAYNKVVDSSNAFLIPLGFNEGIVVLCEELDRQVVLLFDEFDGPFKQIDQRVFLNLRALRDRYDRQLCFVVATGQPMTSMRQENEIGEFCELFAHQTFHLGPLSYDDVQHAVMAFMYAENVPSSARDVDFVWEETGGHPGLLNAVCHVLVSMGGVDDEEGYRLVRDKLDSDLNVRAECVKLWSGLNDDQRETLIAFVLGKGVNRVHLTALQRMGILRGSAPEVFGVRFAGFVRRQRLVKGPFPPGIRVDVDAGEVWVDGRRIPTLTELEYRALLLFYGRMGQLCDKYQVVEAVWGDDYIDDVDDARIEKLISRLRRKIEPDPGHPKYLKTVRGRGYKLAGA
jgi:hypothetical protein